MALPVTPVPAFPNVPIAAGVPPVTRSGFSPVSALALLVSDGVQIARMFQGPKWGIFDSSGQAVLTGDTTLGVDFRREYRISDYPQEAGAFASYNKVQTPYDAKLTFACGGAFSINAITSAVRATSFESALQSLTGESARAAFLAKLEEVAASLDLYAVVTPERTYANANITHYDYRRTSRDGVTLLVVDVWVQEVRVAPDPIFSNTKEPSGANPVNDGTVQTTPVTRENLAPPGTLESFQFT